MDNPFHRRKQSDDIDPFDTPDNYYGVRTDPGKAHKSSHFGRVRTYSMFEPYNNRSREFNGNGSSTSGLHSVGSVSSSSVSPDAEPASWSTSPTPHATAHAVTNATPNGTPNGTPSYGTPSAANGSPPATVAAAAAAAHRAFQVDGKELSNLADSSGVNSLRRDSIVPMYNASLSDENLDLHSDERLSAVEAPKQNVRRRMSMTDSLMRPKKFFINDIDQTLNELLQNEDTDHNYQITIEDSGPKVLRLGTANSNGFKQSSVRGTYMLSNLLQELTIARRYGRSQLILDERRLCENPVARLKRLITTQFWKALTREVTKDNIVEMARDTKIVEEYVDENGVLVKSKESVRLYVPFDRPDQYEYFSSIKRANPSVKLDVQYLPEVINAEFIKSINKKPGLLALDAKPDPHHKGNLLNEPYVVPGGRFNELYGWDSYMIVLGLLVTVTPENQMNLKLSRGMTENFIYEIYHYHKILNANRSYYLGRSQPPFLTDMALRVYEKTLEVSQEEKTKVDALDFLRRATIAAIKEYNIVWCCKPRLDEATGLSCYHPEGSGIPPETEASHFDAILAPYLKKHNISQEEFITKYNSKEISEPDLDEYFLHDRAVRESGHDTTYRLEGKAAYLATVDLNALLYKYETDIAIIIEKHFDGSLDINGVKETPHAWTTKAQMRRVNMSKYLWNEEDSMFYDYNVKTKEQHKYESATCFWPLWSEAASTEQADALVKNSLQKFEEWGGLVSGTLASRGEISISRPSRQWDYPYGWAPQQMLAWIGLTNYHYAGAARRLAYRWLHMMTRAFVDYNGVVVEKYNVLKGAVPHKVDAEYGNQGADFKGVATEGFGWVNASYVFGLTFLNLQAQRSIGALVPPGLFLRQLSPSHRELYE